MSEKFCGTGSGAERQVPLYLLDLSICLMSTLVLLCDRLPIRRSPMVVLGSASMRCDIYSQDLTFCVILSALAVTDIYCWITL